MGESAKRGYRWDHTMWITHGIINCMNSPASALLPIFKTEAQARILAWLLLNPERELPISHLGEAAGLSQPGTLREVSRLVEAGLLAERRIGNTRMVRAETNSPYFEPLSNILTRTHGPVTLVPNALDQVPGVDRVIVVGSWAARYSGEPGPTPKDLDIVVVGEPDRRTLRAANRALEIKLGLPVHITTVAESDWRARQTGFLKQINELPHVVLD